MTAEDGDALVLALEEQGIPATVIGRVTDGKERILLNGEEVRYLDKAQQDSIYKEEK
jgi:hydrogenase maturation factor